MRTLGILVGALWVVFSTATDAVEAPSSSPRTFFAQEESVKQFLRNWDEFPSLSAQFGAAFNGDCCIALRIKALQKSPAMGPWPSRLIGTFATKIPRECLTPLLSFFRGKARLLY